MSEYAIFVTWRGSGRQRVRSAGDSKSVEHSEPPGDSDTVGDSEGDGDVEGVASVGGVAGVAPVAGVETTSPDCGPVDLAEALDGSGIGVTEQYYPDAAHDVVAMVSAPDEDTVRRALADHVDREVQQLDVLRTFSHREVDDVFGRGRGCRE